MEQMILEELQRVQERSFSPLPACSRPVTVRKRSAVWKTQITDKNINTLFDWTFEVIAVIKHTFDTAEVACEVLRLFLLNTDIPVSEYQLAAITAIWLATKMCKSEADDNLSVPTTTELSELTAETCSPKAIIGMERRILTRLDYKIPQPRIYNLVLEKHKALTPESYELRAILFISLICMIKRGITKTLVSSIATMVLKNVVDEEIQKSLQSHHLPALCNSFYLVSDVVKLKYNMQ